MYGFCLVKTSNQLGNPDMSRFDKTMDWSGHYIGYNPMPRFEQDKLFYQDDGKMVLLDGVVFNKSELVEKHSVNTWREAFDIIYNANNRTFMDELRGSFCGVVLDKKDNVIIGFTNHTGERPLYYMLSTEGKCRYISNHVNFIETFLADNHEKLSANSEAAYQLLSNGSCLGNNTPFDQVYRITAGRYVVVNKEGNTFENYYHLFKNEPQRNDSLEKYIEEGNCLFRQAIKRIYDKNLEYGYEAECDLSGGLDSRMATYVAHEMGYRNTLNMCYGMKGHLDHTVSRQIAHDLGNKYSFLHMDGNVFFDVDEIIDLVGGQVFYGVGTGSLRSLKQIDKSNLGMCATGLLGEFVNAYWMEGDEHTPASYIEPKYRYSNFYPISLNDSYTCRYENYEQMNIYEYSLNLFCSSTIVRQQICEVTSPFLDVDYIDYVFRLPINVRSNYKYSTSLMMKYYPGAAKYVWQAKGMPVENWAKGIPYAKKKLRDLMWFPKRCGNYLCKKMNLPYRFYHISDMNPVETWYYRNKGLREFFNNYYRENIDKVKETDLHNDLQRMFTEGKPWDKLMVVNYLGVYKRYLA